MDNREEEKGELQNAADELRQLILGIKNSFGEYVGNKEELGEFLKRQSYEPIKPARLFFNEAEAYQKGENMIYLSETTHFDIKEDRFVPDAKKFVVLDFKRGNFIACFPLDDLGRYKLF